MANDENGSDPRDEGGRGERNRFQRLGDQLSGLLDPEAALRRGAGLVTGASQATKEELMRIVGAEVRGFLDKMDIADLAQQIIAGLVVDVHMTVKFSRDESGQTQPKITRAEADVRSSDDDRGAQKKSDKGT
jgi:hypothetical protein